MWDTTGSKALEQEVNRDLVQMPPQEIRAHLSKVLFSAPAKQPLRDLTAKARTE
jgi:hypothetical protein